MLNLINQIQENLDKVAKLQNNLNKSMENELKRLNLNKQEPVNKTVTNN